MNLGTEMQKSNAKSNRSPYKSSEKSQKKEAQRPGKGEDWDVTKLLRQRDPIGVERLIDRYQDKLFAVVNRICINPADSEEVLQDIFMTAYEKIDRFEQRSSLSTWLYRIAVNGALMKLRENRHKYRTISIEDVSAGLTNKSDVNRANELQQSPADKLMQKEFFRQLADSFSILPEIYQEVFFYRDVLGYSIKETSERLETTPSAIKSRLHRSRQNIRKGLNHYLHIYDG